MTDHELALFRDLHGRVGLFGGSFDPPHLGHLEVARTARDRASLDWLVFVPARESPHKPGGTIVTGEDRLGMVRAAVAREERFLVSALELRRPGPSYTLDTLLLVRDALPNDARLVFVMGSDSLRAFPRWRAASRILALAEIVIVERREFSRSDLEGLRSELDETEVDQLARGFLDREPVDVSSTGVREALERGEIPREALPEPVVRYVRERGLYGFHRTS